MRVPGILILLVFLCNSCIPRGSEADKRPYKEDAEELLKQMTLDEKIGQLVAYTSHWDVTGPVVSNDSERYIKDGSCGAIFNAHEVSFNRKLQELAVNESRLGIPLLFGYDVIHGYRTTFPISLGEAASWNPELIEKAARVAAVEASACGVNWTFAPMVDISFDPRWGRVAESTGEDTYLGNVIAKAKVRGFQGDDLSTNNTLLACVKHYAAYGAPQAGRDYHTVDMSDRVLREVYLPPFKAAIDAGVGSVMTSFNEVDGMPVTGSKYLLDDILRKEWGFNGFIVTDYTGITEMIQHGVAADTAEAAVLAINAGVNIDMESSAYRVKLRSLVASGKITEEQIDKAVLWVLEGKFSLGLFDDPYRYFDEERQETLLSTEEHLDLAYELAAESLVLLKNKDKLLPLKPGTKVAVIGPHATLQRDLLGSWIADGKWKDIQTILQAIEQINGKDKTTYAKGAWFIDETDKIDVAEAIATAGKSDVIVLALGESWHWSGEAASRTKLGLPKAQTDLIRELKKLNKPMVMVVLNGRPLTLVQEYEMVDAMVEAWYPGTKGASAIADALFGKINPSGKLTMSFPRNVGQIPIHYNMKNTGRPYDPEGQEQKYRSRYIDSPNEPLFPFGFGLSYTDFIYDDLRLSSSSFAKDDSLIVSVNITNAGPYEGKEVVQLYIRDLVGSVTRPVKELKGFTKINLAPGEQQTVSFTITEEDLKFYRADMTFGAESGDFHLFVGRNSSDLIKAKFTLDN
ncbi:MAG: beta-glucosidase BglX [Bacteroidales bacterium]